MIAQILNRDTVLEKMREVRDDMADPDRRRSAAPLPAEAEDLTEDEIREALQELDAALSREDQASSGQPMPTADPGRRGEGERTLDALVFISRDPIVSLFQTALEMYVRDPETEQSATIADDGRRSEGIPLVTEETVDDRRIGESFSITDPRWVSSVFAMGVRKFRRRREFPTARPAARRIADNARLILVGDWGSGIPRAQKLADQIRVSVERGLAENRQVHVIHLGDVYYSGFEYEYKRRFLPYWPVAENQAGTVGSWCLNGNHDMYAGGYAYYDFLLREPRFASWQGQSSFFVLENAAWRIFGLDTAWDDDGLKDPQAEWVRHFSGGERRKQMLLSHHQLFSVHEHSEKRGRVLREKLGFLLGGPDLRAWFWGHEHRCAVYSVHGGVAYSACIGHGGVPSYMTLDGDRPLTPPSVHENRAFIQNGLERWAYMGFTVVDLNGDGAHVTYIDENGQPHHTDTIR
jgi:hypothetical protein